MATMMLLTSRLVRYVVLCPLTLVRSPQLMDELRFQCFEVEKMQRARHGLLESKTFVLAKAASARHSVENLARRSRLLQRIIRSMNEKVRSVMSLQPFSSTTTALHHNYRNKRSNELTRDNTYQVTLFVYQTTLDPSCFKCTIR